MSEEVITIQTDRLIGRLLELRDGLVEELSFWAKSDAPEALAKVEAFELSLSMLNAAVFNGCADSD